MDLDFYTYLFKRLSVAILIVVGFCLLPGPRSLLVQFYDHLATADSLHSMRAGLHLSVIHFCWLLGFEMPPLEFPNTGDHLLTAAAILGSILVQLVCLQVLYILWRMCRQWYFHRLALKDELAEFGDLEADEELPIGARIPEAELKIAADSRPSVKAPVGSSAAKRQTSVS